MPGPIRINPDALFGELRSLRSELESFPSAVEVAMSEGGSTPATSHFRTEVTLAASAMSSATTKIVKQIDELHAAMSEVITLLAENDATVANESDAVRALLDSAAAQGSSTRSTKRDHT